MLKLLWATLITDLVLGQHPEEGEKNCKSENVTRKHGTVWAVAAMGSVPLHKNQCTECSCTVRYFKITFINDHLVLLQISPTVWKLNKFIWWHGSWTEINFLCLSLLGFRLCTCFFFPFHKLLPRKLIKSNLLKKKLTGYDGFFLPTGNKRPRNSQQGFHLKPVLFVL